MRSSSENNAAVLATFCRSSAEICSSGESLPATFATNALRRKRTSCLAKCEGLCPSVIRRSSNFKRSSLELHCTQSIACTRTSEETVPISPRTCCSVSFAVEFSTMPQQAIAWSIIESASRMDPSPASASTASASSSALIFSCAAISRSWRTISSKRTA